MTQENDIKTFITRAALENAIKFEGVANPKALVGKVLGTFGEYREKRDDAIALVEKLVAEVNALSLDEQTAKLQTLGGAEVKEKKDHSELKDLTDAKPGNVVMRFAPSPSGPMHIGHGITGGLSSLYVKKYGGKFILRIEDTNADNIDPDAYELLVRDAKNWFYSVDEVIIQSDRMEVYYEYAEKMLKSGNLYIDTTSPDEFREYAGRQEDVPDKALSVEDHLSRWNDMLSGKYKQGEVVVRFKGDMKHKNPAMRDFPLFRINESSHPRVGTKYKVWPLMNFSVFVDDYTFGLTHTIRGKDHTDNARRQELLFDAVGAKPPLAYFIGKYNFDGLEVSCSKTRAKIAAGIYNGWEDIRLPFLEPLRRRGFKPESLLLFSKALGLSKVDKTMDANDFFIQLASHNKDLIDATTKRLFFIEEAHELNIDGLNKKVELSLYPENHPQKIKGGRTFSISEDIIIESKDAQNIKLGVITRLADLTNIVDGQKQDDETYDGFRNAENKGNIIHWLPKAGNANITVLMPDNVTKKGVAEVRVNDLTVGEIVQFERFGFCRLDSISDDGTRNFWFGHK